MRTHAERHPFGDLSRAFRTKDESAVDGVIAPTQSSEIPPERPWGFQSFSPSAIACMVKHHDHTEATGLSSPTPHPLGSGKVVRGRPKEREGPSVDHSHSFGLEELDQKSGRGVEVRERAARSGVGPGSRGNGLI